MKKLLSIAAAAFALLTVASCSDDDTVAPVPVDVDYTMNLTFPVDLTDPAFTKVDVTMKNTATGELITKSFDGVNATRAMASGSVNFVVASGTYDVDVEAVIAFKGEGGNDDSCAAYFRKKGVAVSETADSIDCTLSYEKPQDGDVEVRLILNLPEGFDEPILEKLDVKMLDLNTGDDDTRTFNGMTVIDSANPHQGYVTLMLDESTYDFSFAAEITYMADGSEITGNAEGERRNVEVKFPDTPGETRSVNIELMYVNLQKTLLIEEIFFTGTMTPADKQYTGDKYFKIFNNSDEVIYADGVAILESEFTTITKQNYTPDIMSTDFAVGAVYVIPGSGTDVPVQPGEYLVISDRAMDHTTLNPNSFNLDETVSDFEWYDDSSNPSVLDTDNPGVPNLDKWYCYTLTIWGPHNRGFKSYAIARMGVSKEAFLADYVYDYDYDLNIGGTIYPMSRSAYSVPNAWIIDAVNLSVESKYEWGVFDSSLDRGWTYCGKVDADDSRYGKSVRRKTIYEEGGRRYLKDTNDSGEDFMPEVRPSLMPEVR